MMDKNLCAPLLRNRIQRLCEYLREYLPFLNSHMVNYIIEDHWCKHIPENIRNDIQKLGEDNFFDYFHNFKKKETIDNKYQYLNNFILKTASMTLDNDEELLSSSLKDIVNISELETPLKGFQQIMSHKKMHEVDAFSAVVNKLCHQSRNTSTPLTVVDIGGGKGYLSSLLALEHKLNVIGIDSSPINTSGAAKRNDKLKKAWDGLTRRAAEAKQGLRPTSSRKKSNKNDTDITQSVEARITSEYERKNNYAQVTQFVTSSTDLEALIEQHFHGLNVSSDICLTGLHTCGNLSASCMRIYENNPNVKVLINVGCCYHLIDEEFGKCDFWGELDTIPNEIGFPMSKYLRNSKFSLGRNARMVSCQAIDRRINTKYEPNDSLFYRALLEVVLENGKYLSVENRQVGRIAAKCSNFNEYIIKAFTKYGINLNLTEEEIKELLISYEEHRKKLQIYHFLRMILAPVVESFILLDRLMFLLENGHENSGIVKLFDSVISPRCYALISLK